MLSRRLGFAICLSAMVLWGAQLDWKRIFAGYNDFMQLYAGGKLAGTPDLYSTEANRAIDERIGYWMPAVQYVRPPFYAALLKPLSALPYRAAYLLFQTLCVVCIAGFAIVFRRRFPDLPWLLPISIPLLTATANGQDVAIVLVLAGAALLLEEKGRPLPAGVCLALCAIKFHLFLFTPVALLFHRRWRMAAAAALGVAVEFAVSFVVAGRVWPARYLQFLRNPVLHPKSYLAPNLSGIAGDNFTLEVALALLVAAAVVWTCWRAENFAAAFVLCIYGGLLTAHHGYIQDCVLLLLVPVFIARQSELTAQAGLLLFTPFPYFLLMLGRPVGVIGPGLFTMWFVALAMDVSGLHSRLPFAGRTRLRAGASPEIMGALQVNADAGRPVV